VVLTGGIASGKTAVSNLFAQMGVPVIDTDCIARELVEPGQPALRRIAQEFGTDFLEKTGRLDRRKMRNAVFNDVTLKTRLESILHPLIAAEARRRIRRVEAPYCILVVPLYAESARWAWVDYVLVVDVAESVQFERVMARDGIDRRQAKAILDAQSSRESRLKLADDVIENGGTLDDLRRQVGRLHRKFLVLAEERH
jgi:dephospho-CoA kinase